MRRVRLSVWLALLTILSLFGFSEKNGTQRGLGDLSGPWQLFVDDYLVDSKENLKRVFHPFKKDPANPLPGGLGTRASVLPLPTGSGYQAWFKGKHFTSKDGRSWHDSKRLAFPEGNRTVGSVIHTPWEPDRAYKMVVYDYTLWKKVSRDPVEKGGARYGLYSADGLRWTEIGAPLFGDRTDTGRFNWDPLQKRYFGTPKVFSNIFGHIRRCVGFSASEKFQPGWPTAELMLVPDAFDDRWVEKPGQRTEFYSLSAFAYESMYMGLLEVYRNTDGWKDGVIFIELVTSRDGLHWERPGGDRQPILGLGPAGAWDSGLVKVPNHPLVEGDSIKLFYGAGDQTHGFGRQEYPSFGQNDMKFSGGGLATLRKDGFASLDAGPLVGGLTTKLLRNARGTLAVNFAAQPQGWLKVEVLDERGTAIPGYKLEESMPLVGDSVNQTVSWRKAKTLPEGQPIRLRFVLRHASLFSFNAGDSLRAEAEEPPLAVLYTFEGDHGQTITDQLTQEGAQGTYLQGAVVVDDNRTKIAAEAPPAFGKSSLLFLGGASQEGQFLRAQTFYAGRSIPAELSQQEVGDFRDTLEIENSFQLGTRFTLAAAVRPTGKGHARLFSSWEPYPTRVNEAPYQRKGWIGTKELILDFDPSGRSDFGCLRLAVQGETVNAPCSFSTDAYHHLAATYDNGKVELYLDGKLVAQGKVAPGRVSLLTNLRVGEDPGGLTGNSKGPTKAEQLLGSVDDLLVFGRALSADDIRRLSKEGAEFFFAGKGSEHPDQSSVLPKSK